MQNDIDFFRSKQYFLTHNEVLCLDCKNRQKIYWSKEILQKTASYNYVTKKSNAVIFFFVNKKTFMKQIINQFINFLKPKNYEYSTKQNSENVYHPTYSSLFFKLRSCGRNFQFWCWRWRIYRNCGFSHHHLDYQQIQKII